MRFSTLLLALLISSVSVLNGQNNFWHETNENIIPSQKTEKVFQQPTDARYFALDMKKLKATLKDAPMEYTGSSKELIISFPVADGLMEEFIVSESPVMAPKLAAKYPNIKTYSGVGKTNPSNSIRFDYTPKGFHASIHTLDGKIYIDPYTVGNENYCMVYNTNKLGPLNSDIMPDLGCGVTSELLAAPATKEELAHQSETMLRTAQTPVVVKVYRLALACTGEYGARAGGTKELVNAQFVIGINRINQIFQMEVAIRLQIIEDNDNLIFLDGSTDPYDDPRLGTGLLGQNRPAFILNGIPDDVYDVGHVFTIGCTDVGGVVSGTVCTDGKSRGVTCHFNTNVEAVAQGTLAHEIGHQFTCGHSWDNCPNSAPQRSGANAYEPGSGSTIMSYSGACGDQNIGADDVYYNIGSLESFINYSRGTVASCGLDIPNGNNYPVVELPYEDGFYIPARTPFQLTAIGSDEDGDPITYCWEQHDAALTASPIGDPMGNAPIMRSRPPTTNPTRLFPAKNSILANSFNNTEVMPTYDRDLSFMCTVRDNVADGGGTVWNEVQFKVDGESGPFRLSFPSSLDHSLVAGEYTEFTWDPANSQNAPVNCKTVNLLISYDNADTFTDTLAKNVINDGSFFVNVPERTSNITRIKIEAADNIFFDFSNNRIEIEEATEPNYTFTFTPEFQQVCAPANVSLDVFTGSILGFDNPVELSISGELPEYISNVNFVNSSLMPGERTSIEVAIDEPGDNTVLELTVQAVSADADTTYRTIQLDILSTDFSSLSLDGPEDGLSGVLGVPDFVWSASASAQSFNYELATSPDFSEESLIVRIENLEEPAYQLDRLLEPTTLYYWRITPIGLCGEGLPSAPSAFHSASVDCQEIAAEDLPLTISSSFSGDLISKINVISGGAISDLNVVNITGNHNDFSDLSFSIKSPAGTEVKLVSNKCFGQSTSFDLAFDQESPFAFQCPPRNIFSPEESLEAFIGEDTEGIWEFVINDRSVQFGGKVDSWALEFCSSIALNPPTLVRNNSLDISRDFEKTINNGLLRVEDNNNADFELIYTMVTEAVQGQVLRQGVPLQVGDIFSQFDLNNNYITYKSNEDVDAGIEDGFLFTVIDGDGGWTGTHQFTINFVNENVSTRDLSAIEVEVMPNPVSDLLYVKTNNHFALDGNMEVYNLQGQLMIVQDINGNVRESINTSRLGNGIYFLKIQDDTNYSVTKFVVER